MAFMIQGSYEQVFRAFSNCSWIVGEGSTTDDIHKDITRTRFFGDAKNCQFHIDNWMSELSDHTHYTQGNMSAGNLFLLLSPSPFKNDEDDEAFYQADKVNICFAFLDNDKNLCGLNLYYRKSEPDKWMVGFVRNTNLLPNKNHLYFISSKDPRVFMCEDSQLEVKLLSDDDRSFINVINEPRLQNFFNKVLLDNGCIDPRSGLLALFTESVKPEGLYSGCDALLELLNGDIEKIVQNRAFQVIRALNLFVSSELLLACSDEQSELYQKLALFDIEDGDFDFKLVQKKAQGILMIYKQDKLDKQKTYDLITQDNIDSHDFAFILGYIARETPAAQHASLIKIAHEATYLRICHSPFQASNDIAQGLIERVILINRLRGVNVNNEIIELLLLKDSRSNIFFKAASEIEKRCQEIRSRLHAKLPEKFFFIRDAEREYRNKMYESIYNYIVNFETKTTLINEIREAERPLLLVTDVDRHPWIRNALMIILNTISVILTLGIANAIHCSLTGEFLFFSRPVSSISIKELDLDVVDLIMEPAV